MDHEHKYNATPLLSIGRCKCGALARWDRKARAYGQPVSEYMRIRLESQTRRISDPDVPHSFFSTHEPKEKVVKEPDTTKDVVEQMALDDE